MSKKLIIIIVIGLIFVAGGYFLLKDKILTIDEYLWNKSLDFITGKKPNDSLGDFSAPEIITTPESLGASPEINPIDKTNPFKDIQTNPFDY